MDDNQAIQRVRQESICSRYILALVVVLLLWLVGCRAGEQGGAGAGGSVGDRPQRQGRPPPCTPAPLHPCTPAPLPTLDASVIAQGRQVYEQHCATCHGAKAEGAPDWEKPDARGNLPAPPHDTTGHTWRHGDGELHRIIRDGWRDRFNKTPELTMPPFKDKLSDAEMWAVITYFKSLWSEEQRLWQWERSQEMPFPTPAGGGD